MARGGGSAVKKIKVTREKVQANTINDVMPAAWWPC